MASRLLLLVAVGMLAVVACPAAGHRLNAGVDASAAGRRLLQASSPTCLLMPRCAKCANAVATTCQQCRAGYDLATNNKCSRCAPGYGGACTVPGLCQIAQNSGLMWRCNKCAAGQVSPGGAFRAAVCSACSNGNVPNGAASACVALSSTSDLCATTNCGANGSCAPVTGQCMCINGFTGLLCDVAPGADLCAGKNCGANGSCSPTNGQCVCTNSFTGASCEISPDPCAGKNCGTGTCSAGLCVCSGGYTGASCEIAPPAISSLAAGAYGTIALMDDGTVTRWGTWGFYNGDFPGVILLPERVPGVTGAKGVAAAVSACAALEDGTAKCWGDNFYGQLGDGSTTYRAAPTPVSGLTTVRNIGTGESHSCAAQDNGNLKCWGANDFEQLNDGSNVDRPSPANTAIKNAKLVRPSYYWSCAVLSNGTLNCWADGYSSGFGLTQVRNVAVGADHICALFENATMACLGNNTYGQLGTGSTAALQPTPVLLSSLSNVKEITAGYAHTCALLGGGGIRCWGSNDYGQLGNGSEAGTNSPVAVSGINNAKSISAGDVHTCALVEGGSAKCWGSNIYGELGDGTTRTTSTPVSANGGSSQCRSVTAAAGVPLLGYPCGTAPRVANSNITSVTALEFNTAMGAIKSLCPESDTYCYMYVRTAGGAQGWIPSSQPPAGSTQSCAQAPGTPLVGCCGSQAACTAT